MKRTTAMFLVVLLNIINIVVSTILVYQGNKFLAVVVFLLLAFVTAGINGSLSCKKCGLHPRTWLATHCPHCGEPFKEEIEK